ncbi:MAG: ATP-binding protein [Candidatus Aminicenantes bacterium]|nr:ATP-binding protein [Candidatus Aminicenantes bacterium]
MRQFSSYGPVNNKLHYYAPRKELIDKAYTQLIGGESAEGGHCLTVWAPRQTGKSWLMQQILLRLRGDARFDVLKINLEPLKYEKDAVKIMNKIAEKIGAGLDKTFSPIEDPDQFQDNFKKGIIEKPLILILDEFDSLAKEAINAIVSAFRNIYNTRLDEMDTPSEEKSYLLHGVALIGIHSAIGIDSDRGSPFNVQRGLHVPNLTYEEVEGMFKWYEKESGREVKTEVIERLFAETHGQPGLTCWLGELLTTGFDDYSSDTARPIEAADFETVYAAAADTLPNNNILNIINKATRENNKHFVLKMFQTGEKIRFRFDEPTIGALYMNGVIDKEKGEHNRYYVRFSCPFVQKRLFNYFAAEIFSDMGQLVESLTRTDNVITPTRLNVRELLRLYQAYLDRNKSWLFKEAPRRSDQRVYEAVFHFNLYAYIDRFLQDRDGVVFPEFPTGNGKIDLLIRYRKTIYGLELKSFSDFAAYRRALDKAAQYGEQLRLSEIYLVTFLEAVEEKKRQEYEAEYVDARSGVTVKPVFIQTGAV